MGKPIAQPQYEVTETLHQGPWFEVLRAVDQESMQSVVLKQLRAEQINPVTVDLMALEYKTSHRFDDARLVRYHRFETLDGRPTLVSDDFGGNSLKQQRPFEALNQADLLWVISETAKALESVHQQKTAYLNLDLSHVVFNRATGVLQLVDLAQLLDYRDPKQTPKRVELNDLRYEFMSPEVAGLNHRPVDFRSDLYSLGVLLFWLATGDSPYVGLEPIERMHAKATGFTVMAQGSSVLVQIAEKLMEVEPERRYQSAGAVIHDIQKVQAGEQGFDLAQIDAQVELLLSRGFYGHQRDIKKICSLIDEVQHGSKGVVWLRGEPGAGKSSLLDHICGTKLPLQGVVLTASLIEPTGLGVSPGWKQLVAPVFRSLASQTKSYQSQWHQNLKHAMQEYLPELSLLYPDAGEAEVIQATQGSRALSIALCRFLSFIGQYSPPVVLCFDDLDQASAGDLELIQHLLEDLPVGVLVLLASQSTLLKLTVPTKEIPYVKVDLKTLPAVHVQSFLIDSLGVKASQASGLSKLLLKSCGGSLFKIKESLRTLVDHQLLGYTKGVGWVFTGPFPTKICSKQLTYLFQCRLDNLSDQSRTLLQQVAIFSGPCSLEELSLLSSTPLSTLFQQLAAPVDLELIRIDDDRIYWKHAVIRSMLLSGLPAQWVQERQLNLSSILRFCRGVEQGVLDQFEFVTLLHQGKGLLKSERDVLGMLRLLVQSGERCVDLGLYQAAHRLFALGLSDALALNSQASASFKLGLQKNQICLWLTENRTFEAQQAIEKSIQSSQSIDKVEFLILKIRLKVQQGVALSVASDLEQGLSVLGIAAGGVPVASLSPEKRKMGIRLIVECLLPLIEHPRAVGFEAAGVLVELCKIEQNIELEELAQMFQAAKLAADGQPLAALGLADSDDVTLIEDINLYKLQSALVHTALVRPYFEPFERCAERLRPLIFALADQETAWAVQGVLWFFDLLWLTPAGPKEIQDLIVVLSAKHPQVASALPAGIEDCFLSPSPKSGRFRASLFEAVLSLLQSNGTLAYTKLTEATAAKPYVVTLGLQGLLLFLAGSLGLDDSNERDLLSQQSIHLMDDLASNNASGLIAPITLLKAERNDHQNETDKGISGYETAQELVGASEQVLYQLVLGARLARLCWKNRQPQKTKSILLAGIQLSQQWGLPAVTQAVEELFSEFFPNTKSQVRGEANSSEPTNQDSLAAALQEISREIDGKKLAVKLLSIILRQTGAQKGILFFTQSGQVSFEAGMTTGPAGQEGIDEIQENQDYPKGITEFVGRSSQDIVLAHAHLRGPFASDVYIQKHQVCSVLCLNLVHHQETFGLLYLECNRVEGAFVETRIEPLKVLINQAWIAWENTRLYERQKGMVAQLKQLDRLKDEFLANTSHELRTPLAGIIGLTEMALNSENLNSSKEPLKLVVQSAKRLNQLVNDLLDFSMIKENRLLIKTSAVDLGLLVENILESCRPLCGGRALVLIAQVPDDLPPVLADRNRLQQVLYNLIGNGIKFCASGSVTVSAVLSEQEVSVTVSDTGVGMEAERLSEIFEPFSGRGESDRSAEGAGLGLSLTKRLVELHQSELIVRSTPGQGSDFSFTLPVSTENLSLEVAQPWVQNVTPPLTDSELKFPAQPRRREGLVLVVEDDPILLKTLVHYLAKSGFGYLYAENGEEALGQITDHPNIDVVLLDVMLPDTTGFEVCQQIRKNKGRADLPVILLTARGETEDVLSGFQMGANDYLVKPMVAEELLARIRSQVEAKQSHEHLRQNRRLQQEVHRRQLTEEAFKSRQRVLLRFFDQLDNAVFSIDEEHCVGVTNQRAEQLLGRDSIRFIGRKLGQVMPLLDNQVNKAIQSGQDSLKFTLPLASESLLDWQLSVLPLGEGVGWLVHLYNPELKATSPLQIQSSGRELPSLGTIRSGELNAQSSRLDQIQIHAKSLDFSASMRLELVELMVLSLRYWIQTTGTTKIELASKSGIWHLTYDKNGTYRTRTLDRYLKVQQFPKKPRWRDLLQTVYYVLQKCPDQAVDLKRELEERVARVEDWLSTQ